MRLDDSEHLDRPWRIHALTPDFRLEDVWALPTPGGPDDFPKLVALLAELDPGRDSRVVRALFALRWRLGALLHWDGESSGTGGRVPTLRERLPEDLQDTAAAAPAANPFTPLYETGDEWAGEIANQTVHGVLHLGWLPDGAGGFRGQMAVLVKPNGTLGRAYMAAIAPFRHFVVYPTMLREFERAWRVTKRGR